MPVQCSDWHNHCVAPSESLVLPSKTCSRADIPPTCHLSVLELVHTLLLHDEFFIPLSNNI